MSNTVTSKVGGRLSPRGTAIILGVAAATVAAVLIIFYLAQYRDSVNGDNAQTQVFVAKSLIVKGTSGTIIGSQALYQPTTLPRRDVKAGAIPDPAYLSGRVAVSDILPGQQLTTADFSPTPTDRVVSKLQGAERAISISIDNVHGSLAQVQAGDRIDLYTAFGGNGGQALVKLFKSNVKVLATPTDGSGTIVLQVDTQQAADFAYAADNTQFTFVLRPQVGASPTADRVASIATIAR